MAIITWLDKIDGSDPGNPQKNVNAADMNQIKSAVNTNAGLLTTAQGEIDAHEALTNNPHSVTKTQVGLPNVDNTSDATKNAATATLTNKTLTAPVINSPTGITKSDVGLSNVTNEAQLPLTLTANKEVTGDFALSLGTNANHLDSLYVYTETQLFLHAQDDLTINVHAAVGTDVVGVQVTPKQVAIAAGFANSTTVYIRDEDSSNAFEITANNGSIVLTTATGFNITLAADNIIINGNIKITGGSPGAGKVLTSDADGDATWATPSVAVSGITGVLGIANGGNGTTTGISAETQAALNVKITSTNIAKGVSPSGTINSVNMVFTIGETIVSGSEDVFLNGIRQTDGIDYGMTYPSSVPTITFIVFAPETGSILRVNYTRP